ncbi:hypothetical protein PUN28_016365 [Cardiocondyla obscurior]|uniref:Uncharacterized protein n=1 Tax=Cardiocondyla obscurior TaxID=286306 RepID=A0AAW2EVM1_9HYME
MIIISRTHSPRPSSSSRPKFSDGFLCRDRKFNACVPCAEGRFDIVPSNSCRRSNLEKHGERGRVLASGSQSARSSYALRRSGTQRV